MFALDTLVASSWTTTCAVGLFTVILLYWYSTRNFNYWKKRGVPYVKPLPIFGTSWYIFRKPFHDVDYENYFKHGPIYGEYEGNMPALAVGDPKLLRDILVKDFAVFPSRKIFETGNEIFDKMLSAMKGDEDWKRIRSIISPTFTTGKIRRMQSIFTDCSKTVVKNFKTATKEGKPVDCKRFFGAYSMDIIASSAFSSKIDSHNDPDNKFVTSARNVFTQRIDWKIVLLILAPWLVKLLKMDIFPSETMAFFKSVTLQIIEERKRTGQVRNDFLQLLMDTAKEVAEDDKVDQAEKDIASNYGLQDDINPQIFKTVTSKKLSINELVAQCIIFFIAGYDTVSSTLSFAAYLLAFNPDVQARLRQEVDEALKEYNGELPYEAIRNMKYLDNVISETMRLYPPLCRLDRMADADYKLGDTGITITKGMFVAIPTYAMHRDPKLYPDPEKFDPDRFTPEERAKRDPYSYLPFGAGPRNCVAMRFALMEVKTCLAQVIANFIIKTCPETKVPLEYGKIQTLLQPKGIILDMEIRKDSQCEN